MPFDHMGRKPASDEERPSARAGVSRAILADAVSDAERISAAVLLVLVALVLWRAGARPRQVALVTLVLLLGILATAAVWDYLESHE
jgi:hypothetical protein